MAKYAIITDGVVTDIIMADEEFITSQNLHAIEAEHAWVGASVDDDGNVSYPTVADDLPEIEEPIAPTVSE
jgi:hypothetical protein